MNSGIAAAVRRAIALPRHPPVSIVFANAPFISVLGNWIDYARAAGAANILVLAHDRATQDFAEGRQVACAALRPFTLPAELWLLRVEMFAALAGAGIDFIHSDADAVWLRLPYDEVFLPNVDLAFSPGTIWPPDIVARWRFVLCCGLLSVRASSASARFFETVRQRMTADADDQAAVNRALDDQHIVWARRSAGETRQWDGRSFEIFRDRILGRTAALTVALLPHHQFPRLPELHPETVVAHPVGLELSTPERLGRLGLWRPT